MLQLRPPIVTVMGHVDHGKTSLLDAIRKTSVAEREHGGITQHIGAYKGNFEIHPSAKATERKQNSKFEITFIDTPGHEAFAKMRARGARVTDLVVLVVAASDGVMPQTKESLEHIKAAGVPFLVAINKIDLPGADPEKVKAQLAELGVLVEGYGGETVAVPVSAKTGEGVATLLEMIAILGEMQNLKADPEGRLEGIVIESRSDSRRGVTATVLVKNGTLRLGDRVQAEGVAGNVKAMFDDKGAPVKEASPSTPVEVLGLPKAPSAGTPVSLVGEAPEAAELPVAPSAPAEAAELSGQKLRVILRADVSGSLEALKGIVGEDVQVLSSGLGEVTDSDVLLAKTTGSIIYGFNVKVPAEAEKLAEEEKIVIRTFKIIYELADDLKGRVARFKNPSLGEQILGKAVIAAEFKIEGARIAGCRVTEGRINKSDTLHVSREGVVIGDVRLKTMKQKKTEVEEAKVNQEFGAILSPYIDFKIGDVLISFQGSLGS